MMHDQLQQMVVAAKILLQKREGKNERVINTEEVVQILDDVISELRFLSRNLSPPLLFKHGLKPCLEWFAQSVADQFRIKVEIRLEGDDDSLPEETGHFLLNLLKDLIEKMTGQGIKEIEVEAAFEADGGLELRINGDHKDIQMDDTLQEKLAHSLVDITDEISLVGGNLSAEISGDQTRVILKFPENLLVAA